MDPLNEAAAVATLLGGVAIVISGLLTFVRWSNSRLGERITEEIRSATHQISPTANGGLSLADVARRSEAMERELHAIRGQIDLLVRIYTEESER